MCQTLEALREDRSEDLPMSDPLEAELLPHMRMWNDLRTAARFPMHLSATVLVDGQHLEAVTVNMSAGGILLKLPKRSPAKNVLEFLLELPKDVTCGETTAAVHCVGHVIRSYEQDGFCFIAAVIDDYRFQ
jgi:hypothetical protein